MAVRLILSPGLLRRRTSSSCARERDTSTVMCVNSSPPTFAVRSLYATGAFAPHPASKSSPTLVHVHRLAVRIRREQVRRDPHRNADAAVTRGIRRGRRISMNLITTPEEQRAVEGPPPTGVGGRARSVERETADPRQFPQHACNLNPP